MRWLLALALVAACSSPPIELEDTPITTEATDSYLDALDQQAQCMGYESYQAFVDDPESYDSAAIGDYGNPEC